MRGHLRDGLDPFEVVEEVGAISVLRGELPDQAALHGVLRRCERWGIVVLSIRCLRPERISS